MEVFAKANKGQIGKKMPMELGLVSVKHPATATPQWASQQRAPNHKRSDGSPGSVSLGLDGGDRARLSSGVKTAVSGHPASIQGLGRDPLVDG